MSSLTLEEFVPYRLSVASNAVSTRISQSYRKRFKLKVAEWRLIAILAETARMTPQDIGTALRILIGGDATRAAGLDASRDPAGAATVQLVRAGRT